MRTNPKPHVSQTVGCAARTIKPRANNIIINTKMAGFSYVEVLISVALIAIALVPAMDALLPATQGMDIHETQAEDHYQLLARIEEILAVPVASLDAAALAAGNPATPSSYSDVYTYSNGRQITRHIFLSRYDGDNADADDDPFTGTDEGLLWVQGVIAGSSLSFETLVSVYE